jgi:hypothetical protein
MWQLCQPITALDHQVQPVQADRGRDLDAPPHVGLVDVGELDAQLQDRIAWLGLTAHPGHRLLAAAGQLRSFFGQLHGTQGGESLQHPAHITVVAATPAPQALGGDLVEDIRCGHRLPHRLVQLLRSDWSGSRIQPVQQRLQTCCVLVGEDRHRNPSERRQYGAADPRHSVEERGPQLLRLLQQPGVLLHRHQAPAADPQQASRLGPRHQQCQVVELLAGLRLELLVADHRVDPVTGIQQLDQRPRISECEPAGLGQLAARTDPADQLPHLPDHPAPLLAHPQLRKLRNARPTTCRSPSSTHSVGSRIPQVSEYQYYEFQAIDRPLSREEQEQLHALSSRARITPTSFTNEYHWGNFRGDPRRMVERYYDAHLYVTNWGTHQLMLRLPTQRLPLRTVQPYLLEPRIEAWTTRTHLILDLTSEDEEGEWDEGADNSLAALIGIRDELATGDLRPLYLGWLSALAAWELEDDDETAYQACLEPPVPAGLGDLTAAQRALADFLRVDADLLAVAAQSSPAAPEPATTPTKKELTPLIAGLPEKEKDAWLLRLALGPQPALRNELLHRLRGTPATVTAPDRRSTAHLLDAAHTRRTERRQRLQRAQAEARAERLTALAREADSLWSRAEAHIATKKTSAYDQAVTLLRDLRDACDHVGSGTDFRKRLALLREANQRRPALLHRLDAHNLR